MILIYLNVSFLFCLSLFLHKKSIRKKHVIIVILSIISICFWSLKPSSGTVVTKDNSSAFQTIKSRKLNKQALFIDVTADWCLTCKSNELLVLNTTEIQSLFKKTDTSFIVLDWTHYDPEITKLLEEYNRNGIPLYIFIDEDSNTKVLPQLLTKSIVKELLLNDLNP